MASRRSGDLDSAESAFRELVRGYERAGESGRTAMVFINLAQIQQMRGRFDDSVAEFEQGLGIARENDDQRRVGLCLGGLATIRAEQGEPEVAEELLLEALDVFRNIDDPVGLGNQIGNLGLMRQAQGRLEEALRCFSEAAELFVRAGHGPGAISVLQCLGELHRRQGEYEEAESAHTQALDLAEQAENKLAQAHSHRALGQLARVHGDLATAEIEIRIGLELHHEMGDVRGGLAALIDLASIEFGRGRGGRAIELLDECVEGARATGMVTPLSKALLNRALYRLDTDQIGRVRADLDEAHSYLEKTNEPAALNVWSITSARVLIREGRWDEAEEALSRELSRTADNNLAGARPAVLGLVGSIRAVRGDCPGALKAFGESEELYRALGDVDGARMALLAKARLLAERGSIAQASTALDAIWEASQAAVTGQPVFEAEILSAQASCHALTEAFDKAIEAAEGARDRYLTAGFQISAIGSGLQIANAALNASRLHGASIPEDLVDDLESYLAIAKTLESPTMLLVCQCSLADALVSAKEQNRGRELADGALAAARDLGFPDGEARSLEILARADSEVGAARQAYEIWKRIDANVRAERLREEWDLDG
jgi:tetratricopeptide (TPR) repeat protein